jgi:hypothetical protein
VYDTTLPADVANVPVFMIVVAGHGVFTDPYDTLTPQWQQVTARLLFAALFFLPPILVLAYRPRLRHGGRWVLEARVVAVQGRYAATDPLYACIRPTLW